MKHVIVASPTIFAALAVLVVSLWALYRTRRENEAHKAECARRKADFERQLIEREVELLSEFLTEPANLVMELDLLDEATPSLRFASEQTEPLVSSLSQQEQSFGGSGFTLTAARVEPGAVRLTLSPVALAGSAERVRRVADEWNAHGGPLPPGVTAARADVVAA